MCRWNGRIPRIKDQIPSDGKLTIVKDYIAAHKYLLPAKRQQAAPQGNRGRRYSTDPGETYQMDWGFTDVLDYNGQIYRVACFAMICHHCGERYIEFFPNAKQENLFIGMIHAFQYIHLRNIDIHVSTRYETYTGGLVGSGQNGIYIDDCSITGSISATTSESFARAGGLAASVLRGAVTNSWADVDINAETDTNHVYAGGFYGMDNRVTTVNCYALGDVTGNAANNNKVHIGGFIGQAGGIHVNCYAAGNVVSKKTTTDVGIFSGRSAGITIDSHIYYNTEAHLKQGDTTVSPAEAIGVVASGATEMEAVGKTAIQLAGAEFAALLNENRSESTMATVWAAVTEALAAQNDRGFTQQNYYTGNALLAWTVQDNVVGFGTRTTGGDNGDNGSGGNNGTPATGDTGVLAWVIALPAAALAAAFVLKRKERKA